VLPTRTYVSVRIQCSVGNEWKPQASYSKRQLENFLRTGQATCRDHSCEPAKELKCEGPCGSSKPLNEFSKSTRVRGNTVGHGYIAASADTKVELLVVP